MKDLRYLSLLLLLAWPGSMKPQEVKFVDLTSIAQRTRLRHPEAPPPDCKNSGCVTGGSYGVRIGDGAADLRDPHSLGVYLLPVTSQEIDPAEPLELEFRVCNTGTVPIDIPVSPHLSDLQPSDESASFRYLSLALVASGEVQPPDPKTAVSGYVELYGSSDDPPTMLALKPGEWIRVKAKVKLLTWPTQPVTALFHGEFWLRKNTFGPSPGGAYTETDNLYPNTTNTPPIEMHLAHRTINKTGS